MNRRMIKKNHFTLVELLVAMAVFSILLLISMQLFSSSRQLWLDTENRNRTYANARTAMEFIASRIQTQAYTENMPFFIDATTRFGKMYFPTAIPMNRKDADGNERDKQGLRFIGLSLSEDGILKMHIFSDENKTGFQRLMPPFTRVSGGVAAAYSSACNTVADKTVNKTDYTGEEYNVIELAENVDAFTLRPYMREGGAGTAVRSVTSTNSPPYLLEIELRVIDSKENFKKRKDYLDASDDTAATEVLKEHSYTFVRSILLNYRGARN